MKIPQKLTSGDSFAWIDCATKDNLGNTIDSSWTLKYSIRGPASLDLTATANGTGWMTSISKTQSATLSAGVYFWQAFAEKDDQKVTLGNGRLEILKNLALEAGVFDGRTQARKDLEAVQSAIRALVSGGAVQEYTIGNRSFRKMDLGDLRALESKLLYDVNLEEREEKIKAGLGDPHNLKVRFK